MTKCGIRIEHSDDKGKVLIPVVESGVSLTWERRSTPSKLEFTVLKDELLSFHEGAEVGFYVDDKLVYLGYVFDKKRNKGGEIKVTCYDQLRYLKNKDSLTYENKRADEVIKLLADDFEINTGELANTEYVIALRVEDNKSLYDMIETALDLTLANTGELYILYDDCGKLTLKNIADMYVKNENGQVLGITAQTAEDYTYSTSIDSETYNRIRLVYKNEDEGINAVYEVADADKIKRWGVLQYYDTLDEGENGDEKARTLLKLYDHKTRTLDVSNAVGDMNVRAGSILLVMLNLGDIVVQNYMIVSKVVHHFEGGYHGMDLSLMGGDFVE